MEKKNIDWSNLGFSYVETDKRYVSNYKDGAWDGRHDDLRCKCGDQRVRRCASVCTDLFRRLKGIYDRGWTHCNVPT